MKVEFEDKTDNFTGRNNIYDKLNGTKTALLTFLSETFPLASLMVTLRFQWESSKFLVLQTADKIIYINSTPLFPQNDLFNLLLSASGGNE